MARSLATVLRQIPDISCIEGDEQNLLIGTTSGQLLHFVIQQDDPDSTSFEFTYLLASKQQANGGQPPKKIILLPIVQLAAVLANEQLSFYTLPEFAPTSNLRVVKDVQDVIQSSSLADRVGSDVSAFLTVFTKRKIRQIKVTRAVIKLIKEVEYLGCLAACQRDSTVCAATRSSYSLIDMNQKVTIPLFPVVQGESDSDDVQCGSLLPHIVSVTPEEFLLVSGSPDSSSSMGMFITLEGEITRGTLMFNSYPRRLLAAYPNVITLLANQTIVVHSIKDQELLQTLDAPGVVDICLTSSGIRIVSKAQLDRIRLVHNQFDIDAKQSVDTNLNLARRIASTTTDILAYTADVVMSIVDESEFLAIDKILDLGNIQEALSKAEKMSQSTIPAYAEKLFHELAYIHQKAGLLYFRDMLFDDAIDNLKKGGIDPRVLISLFPEFDIVAKDTVVYAGLRDVIATMPSVDNIIATNLGNTVDDEATLKELTAILRSNAIELLRRYLTTCKEKRGFASTVHVSDSFTLYSNIDSTLLRILLSMDRAEVRSKVQDFLSGDIEDPQAVIDILQNNNRWQASVTLHAKLKNHREVLRIWRDLESNKCSDLDYKPDSGRSISEYLLQHPQEDLVMEFGIWLLQHDFKLGTYVFTNAVNRHLIGFSFRDVLQALKAQGTEISIYTQLLEYAVLQEYVLDNALSHELVSYYAKAVIDLLGDEQVKTTLERSIQEYRALPVPKMPYLSFIPMQDEDSVQVAIFHATREKFINLLQSSVSYDAQNILTIVIQQREVLLAERILLYGRLLKHAESLNLLVHDLKDFDSSEVYCYHGGISLSQIRISSDKRETVEMRKRLFPMLFSEYLTLSDYSMQFTQGSQLLNRWGNYMDIAATLDQLPDQWSLELIGAFLTGALAQLAGDKREAQIRRSLTRTQAKRQAAKVYFKVD